MILNLIPGMQKVTALLAVQFAQIQGENLSEMEDGKIPANAEGSVVYTPKD